VHEPGQRQLARPRRHQPLARAVRLRALHAGAWLDPQVGERIRTLALLAAALVAAACGRGDAAPGETQIEFWAFGREGEAVRALVPGFERAHPGLRVRVQQVPWSAAHEKLLTAWVGGALPDAFQLGVTWVAEFASVGALATLDSRVAASAALPADDFFPGLLDATRYADASFALPWYADTRLFFYRSDLLAGAGAREPPRSWDGWRAALAALRGRLGPDAAPLLLPLGEWELPVILALQRDAGLLREGGRFGDFQSPAFRAGFADYLALYADGLAARTGAAQVANLYQDFAAGRFAAFVTGPWNLGELAKRLPPELEPRWATAPLPALAGDGPGVSLALGAGLAISASSPRQDAASAWLEYLAQPAQQVELFRLAGDLPARRSAWDDPALAGSARARAFRVQLEHLRAPPAVPEWEQIASRIARHAEAAVRGEASPDEALAALDADADRILEKRRWLLEREAR
jgi:multiple sugar transport system substrate-binding protein